MTHPVYFASAPLEEKSDSRKLTRILAEKLAKNAGLSAGALRYLPSGKPVFEKEGYLSVSHTAGRLYVAVSKIPVGLDAEVRRPEPDAVKRGFFTETEKKQDFFSVWTGKEAVSKLLGTGLAAVRKIHVYNDAAVCDRKLYYLEQWEKAGVVFTLATEREIRVRRANEVRQKTEKPVK